MKKHVCSGLCIGFVILGTAGLAQATSLVITGVIDGPLSLGRPKAVELYVLDDISNLGIYGLGFANNGGGSDGIEYGFATIGAARGDFLYVASDDASFNDFFGFTPDAVTTAANINGDDAIELFRNETVVDVFGDIAVDGTGQPWEYLDGWAYRHNGTGGTDSSTFMPAEWFYSGINALDGETANITAAAPFPAGSFLADTKPQPVPTPEPATLFLFGSGIVGLAGTRIKEFFLTKEKR